MSDAINTITARRGHIQALAFAAKGGAALGSLLFSIAKRKEEEGKGPIETLVFLQTHYSDEEGHNIPAVGSKMGETGNLPYDRYTTEVTTADGKKKVPGSWFTDAVKATQEWSDLNQRREWCKVGQGEGVPADILAMKTGERAVEVKRISNFIANMRTGLTKGAMLLHQVDAINAMHPERVKVKLPVMLQKGEDGSQKAVVTGNLIRLQDPSGIDAEDEVVTVGSFLQYDADKAGKADDKGTITSLKATASKAPKKAPGGQAAAIVEPKDLNSILTLFNVLASAMSNDAANWESKLLTQIAKVDATGKRTKEGTETLVSVGKVCLAIDSLWTVIREDYDEVVRAEIRTQREAKGQQATG